jgi:hypothetical protein
VTILSLDPSLTCTGYAVITAGKVMELGTIKLAAASDDNLPDRLIELARDIRGLVGGMVEPYPDAVVIERPQTAGGPNRGTFAKQSPMTIAAYGAAFGAVLISAREMMPKAAALLTPTPAEWVGRNGVIPSSANDPHKTRRVAWVQERCPEVRGQLGPKTTAGNVADAILIGLWARGILPLHLAKRAG